MQLLIDQFSNVNLGSTIDSDLVIELLNRYFTKTFSRIMHDSIEEAIESGIVKIDKNGKVIKNEH